MSATPSHHLARERTRAGLRFLATALPVMALLYLALYFPYARGTLPERALSAYVVGIATVAGKLLHLVDHRVSVINNTITGPFPLTVILDCTALDAQMLFAAAVLAFPSSWRQKALGWLVGLSALTAINLLRIAVLFWVGLYWPRRFHLVHEEICQFVIVAAAFSLFARWVRWLGAGQTRGTGVAEQTVHA